MKIYQLIYTSARNSLSDSSKGLSNKSGPNVYSCSEGITRENIGEITRFCLYRLPKHSRNDYSKTPFDPSVPNMFPKMFRTVKLSDGRYAAIQIVYSGYDFSGNRGNQFAHALVFDEFDDEFFPEQYYNSPLFQTCLTQKQQDAQIVKYLPELTPQTDDTLDTKVKEFINDHKQETEYVLNRAIELMTSPSLKNMCIATSSSEVTDMYLITLKYLLPRNITRYAGISTYNVFMPSTKQTNIIFHGTIHGKNNITEESIKTHTDCIYIDDEKTEFISERDLSILTDMDLKKLRELYAESKISSVLGFLNWIETYNINSDDSSDVEEKLMLLKKTAGADALKSRLEEIYYKALDTNQEISFELSKILFDNSSRLPAKEEDITADFIRRCVRKICDGEEYPISEVCKNMTAAQGKIAAGNIRLYMRMTADVKKALSPLNIKSLTEFLAIVKHTSEKRTWKELFLNDAEMLSVFVFLASRCVIKSYGLSMFEQPQYWEKDDLSELVAYIDASSGDEKIKQGCLKYMLTNTDTDWYSYGVAFEKTDKSPEEEEEDLKKVRRMLTKVGYIPYERGTYDSLGQEVKSDITDRLHPLLLSRLLNEYYRWKKAAGHQVKAQKRAKNVRKLLLELRENERDVYNFIIPKFALEIVESPGHYHETIVNPSTMPESFWNWFILGYKRCAPDDSKILNYNRIYLSHKSELRATEAGDRLREAFKDAR
ncbi:MAG: hypothetical protein LUD03_06540 [Firmicutes bacterium]|nr:hypothetical protein [Bacillota bacterium]